MIKITSIHTTGPLQLRLNSAKTPYDKLNRWTTLLSVVMPAFYVFPYYNEGGERVMKRGG